MHSRVDTVGFPEVCTGQVVDREIPGGEQSRGQVKREKCVWVRVREGSDLAEEAKAAARDHIL